MDFVEFVNSMHCYAHINSDKNRIRQSIMVFWNAHFIYKDVIHSMDMS